MDENHARDRRALRSFTGSFKRYFIEPLQFPCILIDAGDFRAARDVDNRRASRE